MRVVLRILQILSALTAVFWIIMICLWNYGRNAPGLFDKADIHTLLIHLIICIAVCIVTTVLLFRTSH